LAECSYEFREGCCRRRAEQAYHRYRWLLRAR
jgi:hypothetical protein